MKYTIDPTMTYSEAVLFMKNISLLPRLPGKSRYLSCTLSQVVTRRLFPSFLSYIR